ncbi:MAG: primosome assembly protein PriA [Nocardioidaceae bacterium]|nr:primosome assembly protein PriA [Nocardioidaceae bacterium]
MSSSWAKEVGGEAFVARLTQGDSPRAIWTALPGSDWAWQLAAAVAATAASGRGSVVCLPDVRDVERVGAALAAIVGRDSFAVLTSELGPAARYRAFLAVSRGQVRIALGNRAAAFAPVRDLGLVAIWDDGDDLYAEPRAPYHHTREVLLLRAHLERCAALIGGFSCSVEAQSLIESGWAAHVSAARDVTRRIAPLVNVTGDSDAELARDSMVMASRMPRRVFEVVREGLRTGPVLVHSPRYGYQPTLTCQRCRQPARCGVCTGPLGRSSQADRPACRWCGAIAEQWTCSHCQSRALRAPVVGSLRTGQEWGRSFPQVRVLNSGGDHVLSDVDEQAAIVIATPGAEPVAEGGYSAAVLLDTWLTLSRPGLRVDEEALRRWLNVAALVRPGSDGGRVIAVGEPTSPTLQALVRWDPVGFASRGLDERRSARLPPAWRLATLTASLDVLTEALAALEVPRLTEILGPVEVGDGEARVVVRTARERATGLTRALQHMQAGRSSRKLTPIRVQVDPLELA